MKVSRPDKILRVLRGFGFEAYYVGGCVRDSLLNRPVHDWDITTSARPEQVMACFAHCEPTGIEHGTVTVYVEEGMAEVTTFRRDGDYSDGRHPGSVTFVGSIEEDLKRRDFTINAMAMDADGSITDLFGGLVDLDNKVIRCVGEPERRFREDALRMVRALRFSAQLGFALDPATERALILCAPLCVKLSAERLCEELEKVICSPNPGAADQMARLGMLPMARPTGENSCQWLSRLPDDRVVRWAGLLRNWPDMDPMLMRLPKKIAKFALAGRLEFPSDEIGWKRLIVREGAEAARIAASLAGQTKSVERILASEDCLSLRQLAVNGSDFPHLSGRQVGELLNRLLLHVLEYPDDNKKEILMKLV